VRRIFQTLWCGTNTGAQIAHTNHNTHTKVFQSVFQLSGVEKDNERSSNNVVSVMALGGNCSGTRGDAGTANPGPDRDITKGTGRDKTGTRKGHH